MYIKRWAVNISEYGLSLQNYDDNGYMPNSSLGYISFGRLTKLSSKVEREAKRKLRELE